MDGSASDVLFGDLLRVDGTRAEGTPTVSTSWNAARAVVRGGHYRLDFGGKVGRKRITVYVDGRRYGEVLVDGETHLDILMR